MARLELPLIRLTAKGVLQTFTGQQVGPDGSFIRNDGSMIFVLNTGIGGVTMTIVLPRTIDGKPAVGPGPTFVLSGAQTRWFGPFDPTIWNQGGAFGEVLHLEFSASSTLLLALQAG